jgi:hypothetical protein
LCVHGCVIDKYDEVEIREKSSVEEWLISQTGRQNELMYAGKFNRGNKFGVHRNL